MLLEKFGWSDAKVDEALPRLWRMGELVIPRNKGNAVFDDPGAYVSKNPYPSYRRGIPGSVCRSRGLIKVCQACTDRKSLGRSSI